MEGSGASCGGGVGFGVVQKRETGRLRLTPFEVKVIKELAVEVFGEEAKVWIFGSRTDPAVKGGDIDIYIEVPCLKGVFEKRIEYLVKLKDAIGDQKIDLIVKKKGSKDMISREARDKGVLL